MPADDKNAQNDDSKNQKTGDQSKADDNKNVDPDKDKNKDFIRVEEYNKVSKSLDDTFAKLRIAERKIEDIERNLKDSGTKKLEEEGNIEELKKSYLKDKTELADKALHWENRYKGEKKEVELRKIAKSLNVLDSAMEDVIARTSESIDVVETEKNKFALSVKDSHLDVEGFMKKFLESRPYFVAAAGGGGSGSHNDTADTTSQDGITLEQLEAMPQGQFNAAVQKNPKLAALYLRRGKR